MYLVRLLEELPAAAAIAKPSLYDDVRRGLGSDRSDNERRIVMVRRLRIFLKPQSFVCSRDLERANMTLT